MDCQPTFYIVLTNGYYLVSATSTFIKMTQNKSEANQFTDTPCILCSLGISFTKEQVKTKKWYVRADYDHGIVGTQGYCCVRDGRYTSFSASTNRTKLTSFSSKQDAVAFMAEHINNTKGEWTNYNIVEEWTW